MGGSWDLIQTEIAAYHFYMQQPKFERVKLVNQAS